MKVSLEVNTLRTNIIPSRFSAKFRMSFLILFLIFFFPTPFLTYSCAFSNQQPNSIHRSSSIHSYSLKVSHRPNSAKARHNSPSSKFYPSLKLYPSPRLYFALHRPNLLYRWERYLRELLVQNKTMAGKNNGSLTYKLIIESS